MNTDHNFLNYIEWDGVYRGPRKFVGNIDLDGVGALSKEVTSLGTLEILFGDLEASYSNLVDLGNLKEVHGDFAISMTKIESLGNLHFISAGCDASNSYITDLGKITKATSYFDISNTPLSSLGNLIECREIIANNCSNLKSLGSLETIEVGSFNVTPLEDFGNLKQIDRYVTFKTSNDHEQLFDGADLWADLDLFISQTPFEDYPLHMEHDVLPIRILVNNYLKTGKLMKLPLKFMSKETINKMKLV